MSSSAATTAPPTSAPKPKPKPSSSARASAPATLPIPSPSPTSASPVAGPVDGAGSCVTAALSIRALRASGAAGHQYAFLQFTNTSTHACSLTGFPGVQLMRDGALVGKPAGHSGKAATTVRIAPGSSVTAQVIDDSSCNADKSDAVQIIPPNGTDRIVVRLSVRACALTVDPVTAS
ncbi:DUF4232 domain-containing protein [Jatrophihabitans lederbergiae]|uniref:DUF4232 domain-containing protein n=1 Tax=Jatrophihabitans lederbergiae TaxID=3075547 RepID=A0ABU2J787_9ACTN|nr:DUF4232 domain-containing protein [Jatrophihabitans sp. DSM 44399]MDT0260846.1 DUF4232 domain-containing protein [Jatrophihabitans sp. DSM 44399]